MPNENETSVSFDELGLNKKVVQSLTKLGYETPTPIQASAIPVILEGRDILGQAQTGTGKTAAFALPLLSRIDTKLNQPQVLVLAPTRELAIQVAEAFQSYSQHMENFHVLPIYGGQDYSTQLRQLRRGVQVIVGTPGRVMDHLRRGTLKLDKLQALVLDEADEMLRMGFIDDVEWILEKTPSERQTSLFSATMPTAIKRIAHKYLNNPETISITPTQKTADTIKQSYWVVSASKKVDALTQLLEVQDFDGMVVFVRTKTATTDLADKLNARGYRASPLNGDIKQNERERTVAKLKAGKLDILVATDVAARGLDVERVSHVVNFDIPHDTEAYVHRIGRTGRAGRSGEAILFITHREKKLLRTIERATKKNIDPIELPSTDEINQQRITRFKQRITDTLEDGDLEFFANTIAEYCEEEHRDPHLVAAALARLAQGDTPLLLKPSPVRQMAENDRIDRSDRGDRGDRSERRERRGRRDEANHKASNTKHKPAPELPRGKDRYRIEVGYDHEIRPGSIVGAIVNETGIDRDFIGHISIHDDYSTVDLPEDLPSDVFHAIKEIRIGANKLGLERVARENKSKSHAFKPKNKKRKGSKNKGAPKRAAKRNAPKATVNS